MDIISLLAENKTCEAIRRGEFDNLPNRGKPLKLDDLSRVPEALRAAYIILKNANVLPAEVKLHREIVSLQNLINCCYEPDNRKALEIKLTQKMLRFEILMEKRGLSPALGAYKKQVYQKFGAVRPRR